MCDCSHTGAALYMDIHTYICMYMIFGTGELVTVQWSPQLFVVHLWGTLAICSAVQEAYLCIELQSGTLCTVYIVIFFIG